MDVRPRNDGAETGGLSCVVEKPKQRVFYAVCLLTIPFELDRAAGFRVGFFYRRLSTRVYIIRYYIIFDAIFLFFPYRSAGLLRVYSSGK